MNWETFQNEIGKLVKKVDFKPNLIIGITRGGVIPARLLSSLLGVKDMYCISILKAGRGRKVVTEIKEDLNNKSILLVEDMLETGRSMIAAKKYLEEKGAKVKTICLYTMPISEIQPNYYLREITRIRKFPWEVDGNPSQA